MEFNVLVGLVEQKDEKTVWHKEKVTADNKVKAYEEIYNKYDNYFMVYLTFID